MKVVNKNFGDSFDVYIGRGSKWGNPYSHRAGTKAEFIVGSRTEAVAAYRKYITEGAGKHLLNDLHELNGKILGCFCHPSQCHGDVLIELVKQKYETGIIENGIPSNAGEDLG